MPVRTAIFLGCVIFGRYYLGFSCQNMANFNAFCNVLMNKKCSIFTIYASKLIESIKVLNQLNNVLLKIIVCNIQFWSGIFFGLFGYAEIDRQTC